MFARHALRRTFALDNTRTLTRHIQDRVMSTPTWPVPFYERVARACPERVRHKENDLNNAGRQIGPMDANLTKQALRASVQGRETLEHVENNMKLEDWIMELKDSATMSKAYSGDLVKYLNVANKQNVRILSTTNLL